MEECPDVVCLRRRAQSTTSISRRPGRRPFVEAVPYRLERILLAKREQRDRPADHADEAAQQECAVQAGQVGVDVRSDIGAADRRGHVGERWRAHGNKDRSECIDGRRGLGGRQAGYRRRVGRDRDLGHDHGNDHDPDPRPNRDRGFVQCRGRGRQSLGHAGEDDRRAHGRGDHEAGSDDQAGQDESDVGRRFAGHRPQDEVAQSNEDHPAANQPAWRYPAEQEAGNRAGQHECGEERSEGCHGGHRTIAKDEPEVERQVEHRRGLRDRDDDAHEQGDRDASADDTGCRCCPRPSQARVANREDRSPDDQGQPERRVHAVAEPGQSDGEGDDPERPDRDADDERTLSQRRPSQLEDSPRGQPNGDQAGQDRGNEGRPVLARDQLEQDRGGGTGCTVGAIGDPDRGGPDGTAIARRNEGKRHGNDEGGTRVPYESGDQEERSDRHEHGDQAAEQLASQSAQDDRGGSSGVSDCAAQQDQAGRAERSQQDDRLELGIFPDGSLDRGQGRDSRPGDPGPPRTERPIRPAARPSQRDRRTGRR